VQEGIIFFSIFLSVVFARAQAHSSYQRQIKDAHEHMGSNEIPYYKIQALNSICQHDARDIAHIR